MIYRTRLFIDFWNLSLHWQKRAEGRIDWAKIPPVLLREAELRLRKAGLEDPLLLQETRVYASHDVSEQGKRLRNWLHSLLEREPSFQVRTKTRRTRPRTVHCRRCGHIVDRCSNCGSIYLCAPEKGVDTAIVTDLVSLASEDALDVAVLASTDSDFIPPVEWLQDRGFAVVNATWINGGFELEDACWASFTLDSLTTDLVRAPDEKDLETEVAEEPV